MVPSIEEREKIAERLGIEKCSNCLRMCPYCPRLTAVRPDLKPILNPPVSPDSSSEVGFFQKAVNLSRAVTHHLVAGLPHTDDETTENRLEICHSCEHFDTSRSVCWKCGCNMQIKVRWAEQQCPIGKW